MRILILCIIIPFNMWGQNKPKEFEVKGEMKFYKVIDRIIFGYSYSEERDYIYIKDSISVSSPKVRPISLELT